MNPPIHEIEDFKWGPDSLNRALLYFAAALKEEASSRLRFSWYNKRAV